MQLRYDEDFVEAAVFFRANSRRLAPARLQVQRFHREREKLYAILEPDERNAAFFRFHLEWFREWRIEQILLDLAGEFPLVCAGLDALVFRKARVKNDEGAELYVSGENGLTGVVALRTERFDQPDLLASFLRHEFTHLCDMIDPAFGYSPQLQLSGQNAAQQRLTRERYRLLWDITIDGRLAASFRAGSAGREVHHVMFDRAFAFWPDCRRDEIFAALWSNAHPRHAELLALAADPRDLKSSREPAPGAPCPLCGFPTFEWSDARRAEAPTLAAIQKEFPQWSVEQGACGRCVEIYRGIGARLPAIV